MSSITEKEWRERIVDRGRSLFERRYTSGSSGNISVRLEDGMLITPTNSSLGSLKADDISKVAFDGTHVAGKPPSKEAFLHLSMYRQRQNDESVVHLHSTWSVAVSCLANIDRENALPPITAYYVMRVGRLPLVDYFPPGDKTLASAVEAKAAAAHSLLLANHGPIVAGKNLDAAVNAIEELEETARLFMILKDEKTRFLNDQQQEQLAQMFPS